MTGFVESTNDVIMRELERPKNLVGGSHDARSFACAQNGTAYSARRPPPQKKSPEEADALRAVEHFFAARSLWNGMADDYFMSTIFIDFSTFSVFKV
jgi:hypothetical protein